MIYATACIVCINNSVGEINLKCFSTTRVTNIQERTYKENYTMVFFIDYSLDLTSQVLKILLSAVLRCCWGCEVFKVGLRLYRYTKGIDNISSKHSSVVIGLRAHSKSFRLDVGKFSFNKVVNKWNALSGEIRQDSLYCYFKNCTEGRDRWPAFRNRLTSLLL